jgi:hypothetical protein
VTRKREISWLVTFAGGILSGPLLLWTGIRPVWFCHNTVIPASNTCHFRSSPRLGPEVSVGPEARREVGPRRGGFGLTYFW